MLSTTVLALCLLVSLVLSVVIWVSLLRVGLAWAKSEDRSIRKAVEITAFLAIVNLVLLGLFPLSESEDVTVEACVGILQVLLQIGAIYLFFGLTLPRAIQAWLPTLLTILPAIVIAILFRQFVFEAHFVPTNSMAPTILGIHATTYCDECGETCFGSPTTGHSQHRLNDRYAICTNYHSIPNEHLPGKSSQGDRILVSKFLTPKRWDVIAFQLPEDPSQIYMKRLIGLPNEEVYIDEGKVYIDGVPLTPPERLGDIEYESKSKFPNIELSGTKSNPATLASDEYFVLGDFTHRALDSRFWRKGAQGRPSYAVPISHLHGVATHVFWPLPRMRVLR